METAKPLLLTMGDPAGVGPELALRGWEWARKQQIELSIVGSAVVLQRVGERLDLQVPELADPNSQALRGNRVYDCALASEAPLLSKIVPGQVSPLTGAISLRAVEFSIEQAIQSRCAGVVTCPIHKEAWAAAGSSHPGHTELLAEMTGVEQFCMMLAASEIRCALVTIHVGLGEVPRLITRAKVLETILLAGDAVRRMLGRSPRIGVLGLNPHAGEGGLFGGREEELAIEPAIREATEAGWEVAGPIPPDTAFLPQIRREIDLYICMYHDQGLIPLKTLAFDEAVNITLGLPIVRTSVDHGTALDLAWKGEASPSSLLHAIEMAARLVR